MGNGGLWSGLSISDAGGSGSGTSGRDGAIFVRTRLTLAQVNAGATLLDAVAGVQWQIFAFKAIAVGADAAGAASVDIRGVESGVTVSLFALDISGLALTRSKVETESDDMPPAVLIDGASFIPLDVNTPVTVAVTGGPLTGPTHIDFLLFYMGIPPTSTYAPTGPTGPRGLLGPPGIDGDEASDPGWPWPASSSTGAGGVGPAGPTGAQGLTGIGIPGVDGEDGLDGWPGPQGNAGAAGVAGSPGAVGLAGIGVPGLDGEDGIDGTPGIQGATGAAGSPGTPGAAGATGLIGPPGADGEDAEDFEVVPPVQNVAALQGFPGGTSNFLRADGTFASPGASSTPDIALSLLAPAVDETITAGYSAVVVRKYTIASGKKLIIGSAARFRIL